MNCCVQCSMFIIPTLCIPSWAADPSVFITSIVVSFTSLCGFQQNLVELAFLGLFLVSSAFAFIGLFWVNGILINTINHTKASLDGTGYSDQTFLYHLLESYYIILSFIRSPTCLPLRILIGI